MYWAWVRHNKMPHEFYNLPYGAKTILSAFIDIEEKTEHEAAEDTGA